MPPERLFDAVVDLLACIVPLLLPTSGRTARLQRHGASLPHVLHTSARKLLRVEVQHMHERPVSPTEIAPTVQTPSGSALRSVP